jgi:hypothetical protein
MRAILITNAKPYERPFQALYLNRYRLFQVLADLPVQKYLKIAGGVTAAIVISWLIISAGIRYRETMIAYRYLDLITRSVPFNPQQ